MATTQQLLDECNAAISAAMKAQSYRHMGNEVVRANLSDLLKTRRSLEQQLREESSGSMSSVVQVDPML